MEIAERTEVMGDDAGKFDLLESWLIIGCELRLMYPSVGRAMMLVLFTLLTPSR